MKINYNVTGAERKSLVAAIGDILNAPANYLGAPTFEYEVGGYRVDKTGAVTGADNRDLTADLLGLHGFQAVAEEFDTAPTEAPTVPSFEEPRLTEREELGLGRELRDHPGEDGMQAGDVPDVMTVEMPISGFTPEKLDNLTRLVNAKAPLLKAAIGTDDLSIRHTGDTLLFPWFWPEAVLTSEEVTAYTTLISRLCRTAIEKKRVTSREKDLPANPKYAMRCFLLSLGFIGTEYKSARRILLSRLEGNSSWRDGKKAATETEAEGNG